MNNSFKEVNMADQRLKAVYEAASFLFIKKGYENTQVSEIAKKANIATGTVYNLFTGKKSIIHFVLLATFDKDYLEGDITLPIQEMDDEILLGHQNRILEELFSQIDRKTKDGKPRITFMELLSKVFDYAAQYQVAFNIINDNRRALPDLEGVYRDYVNRLYKLFSDNISYYISINEIRTIELPELHIRNIMEGITWWSMYLPYQALDSNVPTHKAKEIALDILKHSYLVNPE